MAIKPGDRYEWIKGSNFGKTDTVKTPNVKKGKFRVIEFASGRSCNVAIANEYLSLLTKAEDLEIDIDELIESESIGNTKITKDVEKTDTLIQETSNDSIYKNILDKIKTFEEFNPDLPIRIELPKKEVIAVLIDAYGTELGDELENYIYQKIDVDTQIKDFIKLWVSQFYKGISEENITETTNNLEE